MFHELFLYIYRVQKILFIKNSVYYKIIWLARIYLIIVISDQISKKSAVHKRFPTILSFDLSNIVSNSEVTQKMQKTF